MSFGPWEIVIIFLVVLLLFGGKKLPELAKGLGKGLREYKNAMICYQKAIKINSNYVVAHNNLGVIFVELGEYKKAIDCYKKAIEINPNYADSHYNLGTVFEKLNEYKKSINCHQKAIEINPNHIDAYNNLLFNVCWSNKNEKYLEFARKYYDAIPSNDVNKFILLENSLYGPAHFALAVWITGHTEK